MGKFTGYSVKGYGEMVACSPRMEPYAEALRRTIRPGHVVLDLGAGSGVFSLLACRLGAAHVHAIEPDDAIHLARALAAANGFANRITFHQALSSAVTLPGRVDVMVSDLRGALPLLEQHIPAVVDARRRFLAPGGVQIPRSDTMFVSLLEDEALYRPCVEPWQRDFRGLDMSAGRAYVVNQYWKTRARREQLLAAPARWATLDYRTIESPGVDGELSLQATRAGTAHGLIVWFDADLSDGVGYSNAPGQPDTVYGQLFFPLQEPVPLSPGESLSVRLSARFLDGDYLWRWETRFPGGSGAAPRAAFVQSSFFNKPVSLAQLQERDSGAVPPLHAGIEVDRFILSQVDGRATLREIAERTRARFPAEFGRWEDALTRVSEVLSKSGK